MGLSTTLTARNEAVELLGGLRDPYPAHNVLAGLAYAPPRGGLRPRSLPGAYPK